MLKNGDIIDYSESWQFTNCIDKLERLGSVLPLVNKHYIIASFSIILSNILSHIFKKNRTVNIYTMYVELYHHLCKFSVDI